MPVDESGAPWPYEPVDPPHDDAAPTWKCPDDTCQCALPKAGGERRSHQIILFDPAAKRMPGARCRVLEDGHLLNKEHPYADGGGAVPVEVRTGSHVLQVEWAPASLPEGPGYPYRKQYHLHLGESRDEGVERRLHNIGFSAQAELADNIRDYQRAYRKTPTGEVGDVVHELAVYHDEGTLPPLPSSKAKLGPTDQKPPPPPAGAGAKPPGGVGKKGSAGAIQMTELRVRVRTRSGRGVENAKVNIDVGGGTIERKTGKDGFIQPVLLTKDERDTASPPDQVTVRARKFHHGPDNGPGGKVVAGEAKIQAKLGPKTWDDGTPGLKLTDEDKDVARRAPFLEIVLIDAGLAQGAPASAITRRLTADEYQRELMYDHVQGDVTLAPGFEFEFDHDPSTTDFDPCTAKCTIKSPKADSRVALKDGKIGPVTWYSLAVVLRGLKSSADVIPGHRFLRGRFIWESLKLVWMDQRHVVGLVRLCKKMNKDHGLVAIYTQGVGGNNVGGSNHDHGLGVDFGGGSKAPPLKESRQEKGWQMTARLGVDFIVDLHWGDAPQWDPVLVAQDPDNKKGIWKRLATPDMTSHWERDTSGARTRVHYRLDPPPFDEAVPAGTDPALKAQLEKVKPHFETARDLFKAVFDFATAEYSDDNEILGTLPAGTTDGPPTPISSQEVHRTIHPDYAKPSKTAAETEDGKPGKDGRGAHQNHIHFQLGPTFYSHFDAAKGKKVPTPRLT
jgi:hypothetical protein